MWLSVVPRVVMGVVAQVGRMREDASRTLAAGERRLPVDPDAKEATRRASISEKSRFYTNDDLAGRSRLTTGAACRLAGPAPAGAPALSSSCLIAEFTQTTNTTQLADPTYRQRRLRSARKTLHAKGCKTLRLPRHLTSSIVSTPALLNDARTPIVLRGSN